jgi:hypothetical protein
MAGTRPTDWRQRSVTRSSPAPKDRGRLPQFALSPPKNSRGFLAVKPAFGASLALALVVLATYQQGSCVVEYRVDLLEPRNSSRAEQEEATMMTKTRMGAPREERFWQFG